MNNKEYLSTVSAEEWYDVVQWLFHKYGKRYTESRGAIMEWLEMEHEAADYPETETQEEDYSEIIEMLKAGGNR